MNDTLAAATTPRDWLKEQIADLPKEEAQKALDALIESIMIESLNAADYPVGAIASYVSSYNLEEYPAFKAYLMRYFMRHRHELGDCINLIKENLDFIDGVLKNLKNLERLILKRGMDTFFQFLLQVEYHNEFPETEKLIAYFETAAMNLKKGKETLNGIYKEFEENHGLPEYVKKNIEEYLNVKDAKYFRAVQPELGKFILTKLENKTDTGN